MIKADIYIGNAEFWDVKNEHHKIISELNSFFNNNKVSLIVTPVIGWEFDLLSFVEGNVSEEALDFLEDQPNLRILRIAIYNGYLQIELRGLDQEDD